MAGQIIKRGERKWLVRVFVGRNPRTGKKKYVSKMIQGTKKDAQAFLNARLREQDLGHFVEPSRLTLNGYLDRWLEEAAKGKLRERTFVDYAELLTRYVRDRVGELRLNELTPLTLQSLYTELRDRDQLGSPSVRKLHVVLSSSLDQAVRWGLLSHNPAGSVQLPRRQNGPRETQIRILSPDEAHRFLQVARASVYGMLFSFALGTGMRPGEYLAMQWQDVDWRGCLVQVRRTLYRPRNGGGWRFEAPKTRRGYRSITLAANLVKELRAHQAEQPPVSADNPDLLFRTQAGAPLDSTNLLRRHLRPLLKEAGLDPKVTLYSLRHSHASILLAAGVNPKVVSERLGHASVQLTLDVYSQVIPTLQRDAADKLDDLLY